MSTPRQYGTLPVLFGIWFGFVLFWQGLIMAKPGNPNPPALVSHTLDLVVLFESLSWTFSPVELCSSEPLIGCPGVCDL